MSTLNREAIPLFPRRLDIPRRLACISSALVRSARTADQKATSTEEADQLHDIFSRCVDVEEVGLQRASQSAGRRSQVLGYNSERPSEEPRSPPYPISPWGNRKQEAIRPSTTHSLPDSVTVIRSRTFQNSSPPNSLAPPSSLRRGSLPNLYRYNRPFTELSPSSFLRFLRRSPASTDSITTFLPRSGDSHPPTHSSSPPLGPQPK